MAAAEDSTLEVEAIRGSLYARVSRDAQASDLAVDEFGYNSSFQSSYHRGGGFGSLQDVFDSLEHEKLLSNPSNFANETSSSA
ncbi:MAG: hypothetical protein M1833_006651 [Piccolia ochrophora]|nr:MAG: hypothetical protein M1833_006651 [Piccolia ochrophora]